MAGQRAKGKEAIQAWIPGSKKKNFQAIAKGLGVPASTLLEQCIDQTIAENRRAATNGHSASRVIVKDIKGRKAGWRSLVLLK
jgi:hypothetical protein